MKRVAFPVAVLVVMGLTLSGCGSGSKTTSASSASSSANYAEAKKQIAPYLSTPATFPITEPLGGSVQGKTLAYMDCGTPVCALGWPTVTAASNVLGIKASRVNAGLQAESVTNAFDNVLAQKINSIIDPALPNPLAQKGLEALKSGTIPAVGIGIVHGDRTLLPSIVGSEIALSRLGEVTATYLVSQYGNAVNAVYYVTPELELTKVMYDGFSKKLKELCPDCKVRSADIPVAALGTSAPSVVTDDLQAHPDTKQAVFTVGEQAIGLPAALKSSGIKVDTIASGPTPDSFQQIKNGDMKAGIGYDLTYVDWAAVDSAARLMLGKAPSAAVQKDDVPMEVLTKENVTADMLKVGWSAFPDIADRLKALWASH